MELPALDLARRVVGAPWLGAWRAVLRHPAGARLEEVRVDGDVHDGREPGVRGRAVVALEEVLGGDLPVAVELRLGALKEPQCVQVDARVGDALGDSVEEVLERPGVGIGVHEDQRAPGVDTQRDEAELLLVHAALLVPARGGDEAAVEAVRPRVVRALERLASPGAFADDRPAVPADVQERAQLVLTIADEDDGHVGDGGSEERRRLRHVALVTDVLP